MKWITPSPATCIGIWIISSLCGTVIFAVWHLAVRVFRRSGYFYFFYKLLRLMPVFFCFPFVVLLHCLQLLPDHAQLFYLFSTTEPIRVAVSILFRIWAAGTICILGFYLYQIIRMQLLYHRKIPCRRDIIQVYENVCREVGGKHFPALYQSYRVKVPIMAGILQPRIYLPVSEWPKQQLSIIFTHELNHYRQRDIWLKRLAALLLALQWMNPVVWVFYRTVVLWSEYACDWLSYPLCGGKKQYFQVITSIAEKRGEVQNLDVSALFRDTGELEKRVQHVQWCGKKRKGAVWVSALLTLMLIVIGSAVTYHTAALAMRKSYDLYLATEHSVELPVTPPPTEYHDCGPLEGTLVCCGATDLKHDGRFIYSDFDWKLEGHTMCQTASLDLLSDTRLTIVIRAHKLQPDLRAGYIHMDGRRSFINVADDNMNTLHIPQDGVYKIFIENMGDTPVDVSGSFTLVGEEI